MTGPAAPRGPAGPLVRPGTLRQHGRMPPLTRAEAETRARLLTVHHYAVDLDLTRGDELFGSTTRIRFSAAQPGATTFAELEPVTLHRAVLNGRDLDVSQLEDHRLTLTDLAADNELLVEADMRYSHTGEGLHRFNDPADNESYLFTQGFLGNLQRVIACFDQPDLKAAFELSFTAPPAWTVLGNATGTRGGPAGQGRWTFAATPPISTYLLAFAAGPYHSVRTEHAGLPFGLHCRRSLAPHLDTDAEELWDITHRAFDHYAELFDEPYPFDSYDQVFVPELTVGAMENPGMVTFKDEFVFRSAVTDTERQIRGMVIVHEMAHMWFGDLVTLRWWDDIWLNESFAEYMGYQVIGDIARHAPENRSGGWRAADPWTGFAVARKNLGYDADQRPSTHPVAPAADGADDTSTALGNFDGISYAKGASAIRQLVNWLGPETFLAGANDHITRHRFGNATLADFTDSLARAAPDRDVRDWADRWLRTTGADTLTVRTGQAPDGTWTLAVDQDGTRPHRFTIGRYDHDPADPARLIPGEPLEWNVPDDTPRTLPGPRPALLLPNDSDLTYARSASTRSPGPPSPPPCPPSPTPCPAACCGTPPATSYATANSRPPTTSRSSPATCPPKPTSPSSKASSASPATPSPTLPAPPPARRRPRHPHHRHPRPAGPHPGRPRRTPHRRARPHRQRHPPNQPANSPTGSTPAPIPGGPALDPELRWRVLWRLAILGATDEARIDAELERDPSSTGREAAARCRAALPTEKAKHAAWQAMFEDDTLTNNLVKATAQGFWQPEQHDLLDEFTLRWFDTAAATSARRGAIIAAVLTHHGFPAHAATDAVLHAGDTTLAREDLLPAFRRGLTDQVDDLRRAARVRARHTA